MLARSIAPPAVDSDRTAAARHGLRLPSLLAFLILSGMVSSALLIPGRATAQALSTLLQATVDTTHVRPLGAVAFVDRSGGDYHLAPSSRYRNIGTNGKDLGVDWDTLSALTRHTPMPTPER